MKTTLHPPIRLFPASAAVCRTPYAFKTGNLRATKGENVA
jgi:hypothetical protein